ncbi:DUF1223 domain-containing protein [Salipiger sp. P9]|uniref:DUF1223 domain-containing protein n=1 Tax=Salipiger pentaromativorans TaxID=2943193 RepID=UPI00215717CE|nr:DUF1223 domain-containing protein [Salipiger pentaromativorans]MCR8546328.1 DUF1223 domain-containing protein [Salipiger pentaromativorans]
MNRLTSWIAAACCALSGAAAQAEDNPVVVELFTSQGCASCPAADVVLAELGETENVIPLALHVDYWDYIGWPDAFADPAFTKRQKGYARASGRRSIYTPQMVIGGRYDVVGSRPMKVVDAIRHAAAKPALVRLTLTRDGATLLVQAEPLGTLPMMLVNMVRYTPQARVEILDGENAGHAFTYTHIAHGWQVLGEWDGAAPLEMSVPVEGDDPVVVMVQEEGYGPILAAARLR